MILQNFTLRNIFSLVMMRSTRIESARQAIEVIAERLARERGLPRRRFFDVGDFLRVSPPAVSKMRTGNRIPREHHLPVYMFLRHYGYEIDCKAVFGYSLEVLMADFLDRAPPYATPDEARAA